MRREWLTKLGWTCVLLVFVLAVIGCDLPFSAPATIVQDGGLPSLHHLDWGANYYAHALWSPDGRWIALLAGTDFAKSHLEVVSPDGRTQYDLSTWGCGQFRFFDYAWLPDGRLSCIRADAGNFMLCIGASPFHTCARTAVDSRLGIQGDGAAWTADGAHLLVAASCDPMAGTPCLCVLRPDGTTAQMLPQQQLVYQPQWRPHTAMLSYILGRELLVRPASWEQGHLTLGTPQVLVSQLIPDASRYTWSPSGHWIAARSGVAGQDRIYLINADHPTETLDVTDAVKTQQILADPAWSPDGKTLLVSSPQYDQLYAINIAGFLHGKGLNV